MVMDVFLWWISLGGAGRLAAPIQQDAGWWAPAIFKKFCVAATLAGLAQTWSIWVHYRCGRRIKLGAR
jgi:hypothetical protein